MHPVPTPISRTLPTGHCSKNDCAFKTSSSVSGRGIKVSFVTINSSPRNSATPVICCNGSNSLRRSNSPSKSSKVTVASWRKFKRNCDNVHRFLNNINSLTRCWHSLCPNFGCFSSKKQEALMRTSWFVGLVASII